MRNRAEFMEGIRGAEINFEKNPSCHDNIMSFQMSLNWFCMGSLGGGGRDCGPRSPEGRIKIQNNDKNDNSNKDKTVIPWRSAQCYAQAAASVAHAQGPSGLQMRASGGVPMGLWDAQRLWAECVSLRQAAAWCMSRLYREQPRSRALPASPILPCPALPAGIADAQHAAMAGWCVQPASPLQDPASSQWPLLSGHDPIDATLGYVLSLGDPPWLECIDARHVHTHSRSCRLVSAVQHLPP